MQKVNKTLQALMWNNKPHLLWYVEEPTSPMVDARLLPIQMNLPVYFDVFYLVKDDFNENTLKEHKHMKMGIPK